jgi:hypothetical protein
MDVGDSLYLIVWQRTDSVEARSRHSKHNSEIAESLSDLWLKRDDKITVQGRVHGHIFDQQD